MSERSRTRDATAFREVVSQWQLAARTEVKRSSSLPSSMFDACDPMLEARLADSVETMMNCLHQPAAADLPTRSSGDLLEMRMENVSPEELQALPKQLTGDLAAPDMQTGLANEYLSCLVDACATGDEATRQAARARMLQDFPVKSQTDLEAATMELFDCVQELVADNPNATVPNHESLDQRLGDLCRAITASIASDTCTPEADAP